MRVEPVTIIGAGPAGLAAAIQLRRHGLDPRVLESEAVGGLLRNANLVENYPGFPGGIPGAELARLFVAQAGQSGVEVTFDEVTSLAHAGDRFEVAGRSRLYASRTVVIATGTRPTPLAQLGVPAALRDRILYEVHALAGVEGRRVAIVGAGDAAFDYALNLARGNDVWILNRGTRIGCLPLLRERARAAPRIAYRERTVVREVGDAPSGALVIDCDGPAGALRLEVDYLIGAVGRHPRLEFVPAALMEQVDSLGRRGVLHLVGDVKNGTFRQASIAVGEGVAAAMAIHRRLTEAPE